MFTKAITKSALVQIIVKKYCFFWNLLAGIAASIAQIFDKERWTCHLNENRPSDWVVLRGRCFRIPGKPYWCPSKVSKTGSGAEILRNSYFFNDTLFNHVTTVLHLGRYTSMYLKKRYFAQSCCIFFFVTIDVSTDNSSFYTWKSLLCWKSVFLPVWNLTLLFVTQQRH